MVYISHYSGGLLKVQAMNNSAVYVFEDTTAGIISVENMQRVLEQNNIHMLIHKFGISPNSKYTISMKAINGNLTIKQTEGDN